MKVSARRKSAECVRVAGLLAVFAVLPTIAEQQVGRPEIVANSVSVVQKEDSPLVEISYMLTGEPAVVTIAIETNTLSDASGDWVSIGGRGTGFLGGEANKVVYITDVAVKAYWLPPKTGDCLAFAASAIRATVTAWPTNNPPDYMVQELVPVGDIVMRRYYASTNDLPGGFENVEYKTKKLLMRKIPAKNVVWWMGSPIRIGDEGWGTVNNVPHKVMLTEDYYAAVYELTIGQLKSAGVYDSFFETNFTDYAQSEVADLLPAERLGHYIADLRGTHTTKTGGSTIFHNAFFCDGHSVGSDSVIDMLRQRTGIINLDLPTEAQWEYACRAGSNTELPCNMEWTEENTWGFALSYSIKWNHANLNKRGPAPVGMLKPNAWGLYDILGNVHEICLDLPGYGNWLDNYKDSFAEDWNNPDNPAITVDPSGPTTYNAWRNMFRGGSWRDSSYTSFGCHVRNAGVEANKPPTPNNGKIGVRLFCPVVGNVR